LKKIKLLIEIIFITPFKKQTINHLKVNDVENLITKMIFSFCKDRILQFESHNLLLQAQIIIIDTSIVLYLTPFKYLSFYYNDRITITLLKRR